MALPWAITIAVLMFKNVANAKAVGTFVVVFGGLDNKRVSKVNVQQLIGILSF